MKKFVFNTAIGLCGGFLTSFLGEYTAGVKSLLIFIAVDCLTGLLVAAAFKNSKKTQNGGMSSGIAFKGICQKIFMISLIGICHQLDAILQVSYLREIAIFAFLANELLSIVENAGLMGVPVPKMLKDTIDILNKKNCNYEKRDFNRLELTKDDAEKLEEKFSDFLNDKIKK